MKINKYVFSISLFLLGSFSLKTEAQGVISKTGKSSVASSVKTIWTSNPFDNQVFIENKGQFDGKLNNGDKILFAAELGGVYAYITNKGIVYRYDECPELHPESPHGKRIDPDEMRDVKHTPHFLSAEWENSLGSNSLTTAENQTYYYTYPKGKNQTIKASVFKKVTCKNIYPGIDIEYAFPKDKSGFKYSLIVHPGANLSAAKLKYSGAKEMLLDADGDININCGWGSFTDHKPVSFYGENQNGVGSGYKLANNEESFYTENADPNKTLVIDPWSTNWTQNPNFAGSYNSAYDVDFDYAGNVYVYGGYNPYQLVQYNSAGVKQWVYNTANFTFTYYGDFCVDKSSGTSYALEGFGGGAGSLTDKISVSGALLGTCSGNASMDEQWRATFDLCDHIILIAGGGTTSSNQGATLDTALLSYTMANVLNVPAGQPYGGAYHDMCLIGTDPLLPVGYMASTQTTANSSLDNNSLIQLPLPSIAPTAYNVSDNYNFKEVFSITYTGAGVGNTNGMNGMAVSPNWLYLYDGKTLKQMIKNTGAMNASVLVPGGVSFSYGGLDVDLCDDIYVGNQTKIDLYNSSLKLTGTMGPFPGNVNDVVLGNGVLSTLDSTLYVCGVGFVSSVKITPPNPPKIVKAKTLVCSCNCTAKATLMICSNPDTSNVSYLWSNGQKTQTATGLCPGNTYTVTITAGCDQVFSDTVIFNNTGMLNIKKASTSSTCVNPGTASVTVSGGIAPYTYLWSTGATTSNVGGLGAGNVCVSITDNKGCNDTVCFIITGTPLPTITINPLQASFCPGGSAALTAGGGVSYTWLPANGLSCTSCPNPTASPNKTTTYTVTGTDANGCKNTDSIVVTVFPTPTITISPPDTTICNNSSITLTASGASTYVWQPGAIAGPSITVTPTVTTTYTITGTDANGCTATTTATVSLGLSPSISVNGSNTSFCVGGSAILFASSNQVSTPYTWQPGGLTGPSITVSPTVTTTYTVSASNSCNNASVTITVYVNPLPATSFTADVMQGCAPLCIQFRNQTSTTSGKIARWVWFFGNGDSSTSENPIYCYPNAGNYSVNLTTVSDSGCSTTLKIVNMVSVYSHPKADFTAAPQPTTILDPTIQFTDKSWDAYQIAYWFWNFGNRGENSTSTQENPSHKYLDTGTYCAQLVVENIHGCTDTMTDCLVISPIFALYIPDAFTPNGDGRNDVFMPKGNDIKTYEMYIFDRWGMQLFHSTDITNGWDGRAKAGGSICQEDTYVYLITVTDSKNIKHTFTGHITLIK